MEAAITKDNDDFIMGQQQKQEQIIRAQDDNLELLGHTVGNLKEIGRTIGDTLESQSRYQPSLHILLSLKYLP
jgi:hypothetical protein